MGRNVDHGSSIEHRGKIPGKIWKKGRSWFPDRE
jgi:hypothetical protein